MTTDARKFSGSVCRQNLYTQISKNDRNNLNYRKGSMDLLKEEKSLFFITENKLESKIEDCYFFFTVCVFSLVNISRQYPRSL